MQIHIHNEQKDLPLSKRREHITALIHFVLAQEKRKCDEIGIFFITDTKMRALHKEFFDDDSPTDCMSFPVDSEPDCTPCYLGDIFVCPHTACKFAKPYEEVTLYILHGLLHLLGYDDIDSSDRKKMRRAEKKYMNHFKAMGLLLHATP